MSSQVEIKHVYHCVGCGRSIPWDGKGIFCYTCPTMCKITVIIDQVKTAIIVGMNL